MIATQPPPILQFAEEQSPELRDRIFDEFNSLAVVYQAPSSTFLQEKPQEEVGRIVVSGLESVGLSCRGAFSGCYRLPSAAEVTGK